MTVMCVKVHCDVFMVYCDVHVYGVLCCLCMVYWDVCMVGITDFNGYEGGRYLYTWSYCCFAVAIIMTVNLAVAMAT